MKNYEELLKEIKSLGGKTGEKGISGELNEFLESLMETVSSSPAAILINTARAFKDEDHFFAHCLNVCVLSIKIGLKKGYDARRMKDLALIALGHAKGYVNIPDELLQWAEKDKEMEAIVKLADIYDTMTHPPLYRHETTPSGTLMAILDADGFFDRDLVRILLDELTLYPEGSWVELNSRQIGKVIKVNTELPLRPVVEILGGDKRTIDLSESALLYVAKALTGDEVKKIREKIEREEE
jgi:HD-GYP domain-containing protein (c-di-GMP phosphodiesterase class II)